MTVIWDYNGTIINDAELCTDILNTMLKNNGYNEIGNVDNYREIFCFPIKEYYKKAGFNFNIHPFDVLAQEFMAQFKEQSANCKLHEGVIEVFEYLKQNKIRQVIISASPDDILKEQVKHLGISHYFDDVLGLDDIYGKSKIELAKIFMEKQSETPDNFIYIGDTTHDYEVACALGIKKCILFSKGHQSHSVLSKTDALIINDLSQIISLINF